jgi:hypothetical protein
MKVFCIGGAKELVHVFQHLSHFDLPLGVWIVGVIFTGRRCWQRLSDRVAEIRMYQRNSQGWQNFFAQQIDLLIPIGRTEA